MNRIARTKSYRTAALSLAALTSSSALVEVVHAQTPADQVVVTAGRGLFARHPYGFLRSTAAGDVDLLIMNELASGAGAMPWSQYNFGFPGVEYPDYSMTAIRLGIDRSTASPGMPTDLELSSISTGGDMIPSLTDTGRIVQPMGGETWYCLAVAVERKSGTAPAYGEPGSAMESVGIDAPLSVVAYYVQDNEVVGDKYVHSTMVENTASQLGASVASTDSIVGLDRAMGLIAYDPNSELNEQLVPERERLFFTFPYQYVKNNAMSFTLGNQTTSTPARSADIYSLTWRNDTTSGWGWYDLEVAATAEELFANPPSSSEFVAEIDALSVDSRNSFTRFVFSTEADLAEATVVVEDELLVYQDGVTTVGQGTDTSARVLSNSTGQPVSTQLGLRRRENGDVDDVKGTCGIDPETELGILGTGVAQASSTMPGLAELSLSVARTVDLPYRGQTGSGDTTALLVSGFGLLPSASQYTLEIHWTLTAIGATPQPGDWLLLSTQDMTSLPSEYEEVIATTLPSVPGYDLYLRAVVGDTGGSTTVLLGATAESKVGI